MVSANELQIPFVGPGEVLAAAITLPIVGIAAIGMRFWQRKSQRQAIGADDISILIAMFFVIGMGICLIYVQESQKHSIAYETPPFSTNDPTAILTEASPEQRLVELLDWITWLLMIPANGLIKLSALFLYRRIFVAHKNTTFDIITKIFLMICGLWTLAFELATIFGCGTHWDYPWKPLIYIASCDTNRRLDALMISDLLTDIIVWLMPIPVVWHLNMKTSSKIGVTGILLLAAVSLAAAIVRLMVQVEISHGGYAAHTDVNLTLTILLYWSMIESGLALIAACLPTLNSVLRHSVFASMFNSIISSVGLSSLRSRSTTEKSGSSGSRSGFSKMTDRSKGSHSSSSRSISKEDDDVHLVDPYKMQDVEMMPPTHVTTITPPAPRGLPRAMV